MAKQLGISPASVSEMAGKLVERGLVTREPYKGIVLTAKGKSQALIVIRRHRLWERFLTDVLGLPWEQVHEEACRLEHITSPLVGERLAQLLGEPEACPHGHPMPTAEGEMAVEAGHPLAELTAGQRAIVLRVPKSGALCAPGTLCPGHSRRDADASLHSRNVRRTTHRCPIGEGEAGGADRPL